MTTATVLFADVVGYLEGSSRHQHAAVREQVQRQAAAVRRLVEQARGVVVRTVGGSVVAEFADAVAAVRTAVDIQKAVMLEDDAPAERRRVILRIGVAEGVAAGHPAPAPDLAMNLAARITARAGPAQIVVCGRVRDAVLAATGLRCVRIGSLAVPGREAREELHEVVWADTVAYTNVRTEVTEDLANGEFTFETSAVHQVLQESPSGTVETPRAPQGPGDAQTAPRYEILAQLGRGGMGVVYKARDRETGDVVALKALRSDLAEDPAVVERFKNELRLARKITHKNVCRIYDFVRVAETAFISMELVEGETLRTVIGRFGALGLRKGVQIARQMCAGLAEAHGQGIIHRDLKPENVMIDASGNVKLMDFGIARSLDPATGGRSATTASVIGTPAYMSPEQAEGRPLDARSDIYSLGLTLYEMFTGVAAFRDQAPLPMVLKQLRERPPAPREIEPGIPPYLEDVILKCIEKRPADRFQSVAELAAALSRQAWTPPGAPSGATTPDDARVAVFGAAERALAVLGMAGVCALLAFLGDLYPVSRIRLQVGFEQARSQARRYLRNLVPGARTRVSYKSLVWIDGRGGDRVEPGDANEVGREFAWEYRWAVDDAADSGSIRVDHQGELESFSRTLADTSQTRLREEPAAYRSRAADLASKLLGFDTARARLSEGTDRYDAQSNQYAWFVWTANQPDARGYRTVAVELWNAGVKSLRSGYAHDTMLPSVRSSPGWWRPSDTVSGLIYVLVVLVILVSRTVNVGRMRRRRTLLASGLAGAWCAVTLEPFFIGLPDAPWTADILMGFAYALMIFVIWATGEDTLLHLWPEKGVTWMQPRDGRWLTRAAAVSTIRGSLYGLAFVSVFVTIGLTAAQWPLWGRLRTWSFSWPYTTTWDPAVTFFIGQAISSVAIVIGPLAVSMALLRRHVRTGIVLALASGFVTAFVFQPEVVRAEIYAVHLVLLFVTMTWFAWCFHRTDLLGTVVGLSVFNAVVGLVVLAAMNLENPDASVAGFVLAFLLVAGVPLFAVVSLRQRRAGTAAAAANV